MSFLDDTGLRYFYQKIKEKFIRSITAQGANGAEVLTPDANGNITVTRVATADNLVSPDQQPSYGTYIYRTSGGDVSLDSGRAELTYVDGNVSISGRVEENFTVTTENNIKIEIDKATWRNHIPSLATNTYTFNYTSSTNTWSPALAGYGLTASNVITSDISISVSGTIGAATVNKTTWEANSDVTNTGSYYFIYNNNKWLLDGVEKILANYGITITTGTPHDNDVITVNYTAATPNSTITVNYTKAVRGTITPAHPTQFVATGFNQFDPNTMVINDATINSNGIIEASAGDYVCYCKAVGGVTNGYIAYSSDTTQTEITNIGYYATVPTIGDQVIQTAIDSSAFPTYGMVNFANNGYVVVAATNKNDLCIHPQWSGSANDTYETYVAPSVIAFPSHSADTSPIALPSWGMAAVGNVADRLDLDKKKYIKNIDRTQYSTAELSRIQGLGVDYDYDNNYIYYVLPTPTVYSVNVNSEYTVNDFGTEEFIGTVVPVTAQTIYGQNLRDKLRLDVEPKKRMYADNFTIPSADWVELDTTASAYAVYSEYPFRYKITCNGITNDMVPEVFFSFKDATSGILAPVAESTTNGVYVYANERPSDTVSVPVIIAWVNTDE